MAAALCNATRRSSATGRCTRTKYAKTSVSKGKPLRSGALAAVTAARASGSADQDLGVSAGVSLTSSPCFPPSPCWSRATSPDCDAELVRDLDRAPATPPRTAATPATVSRTPLLETEEKAKSAVRMTALREQLAGAVRLAAAQEQAAAAAILLDQSIVELREKFGARMRHGSRTRRAAGRSVRQRRPSRRPRWP